ncbi:MAG: peptidoglycan-binding protein [Clostridiales bacterium]|nr:peptidoglycan-binding protein [Clostridiales bacterium]
MYGHTIFDTISNVVDQIWQQYIRRNNYKQPFFSQYNDGRNVNNPGWLSQWGSEDLAKQGYSALQILRYYYGSDTYLATAEETMGLPSSYPGRTLTIGDCSSAVQSIQNQLNVIRGNYPLIPALSADGRYGDQTANAVRIFQGVFNLPQTGSVDYATWYKIALVYTAVAKLLE